MRLDRAKTTLNAEKFVRAGKLPEAIAEYKKLVEDSPRDMNTINKLGDLCARAGKNPDAIRYFLRIAEFYAGDGFFLKAIAMYKKVSKLDPANMDCFQKLAGLYQQQGLTIEAKAQFMAVADHFVKAGQFKKAIEVLPQVLEIEPDNIKVRMSLADLLVRAGTPKDAAREYCQVARDLATKGMFEEAIQVAQKGMKASPGDPDIMSLMLSLSKEAERNPGDLISAVEKMAKVNGDNPRSLALLGEAYLSAGRSADADKVFRKLQGMGEGAPPEVAAAVGRHHLSKDEDDQALEWLSRAADAWAEGPRAGQAAGLLDEFLRAFPEHRGGLAKRAALAEAAGDKKAQATALKKLAQVLAAAGEIASAINLAEQLVGLEPENPQHADILKSLKARSGGASPARPIPATPARRAAPAAAPQESDDEPIIETTSGQSLRGRSSAVPAAPEPAPELSLDDAVEEAPEEAEEEAYGPDSKIQEIQASGEDGEEEDDEFIIEHFTEAEVFIKYGLFEKAKQQLLKILAKHPQHVTTHAKLKEIYYEEGDKEKAVEECVTLAGIMKGRGRNEEAQDLVNEAIRIDPNNPRIKQLTAGTAPRPAPAPKPAPAAATYKPAPAPPAAKPAPAPPAAKPAPAPPAARTPAAPQARSQAATRPAPAAPPELELEELGTGLEIDTGDAEPEMEIEIDLPEEEAPKTPAPMPAAKAPAAPARAASRAPQAAAPAAGKAPPEKIEEETPEDLLGGLSFGEDGDISIESEGEGGTAPATGALMGRAGAMPKDPDPEKLGEVDFYIDQGLLEEARAVLFQLQKQYPESKEVAQRFERANRPAEVRPTRPAAPPAAESTGLDIDIERAFGAPAMKPAPKTTAAAARGTATPRATKATPVFKVETSSTESEGDFFDLAGELDKSLAEAQVAVGTQEQEAIEGPGHSLDEIFKAFKRGVEQQVDSEDYDTHFNLGIAYKEMGLVDEAIGEFQYAAKDPARTVECCEILGLCFRDKGMPQLALKWYQKALSIPALLEQQATGLRYDIAEVYREQGDYGKALQLYTEVFGHDSTYRDVATKLKEMRKLLG